MKDYSEKLRQDIETLELQLARWRALTVVAALLIILAVISAKALAQEPEHPAFGARHISTLVVESDVADVVKLEAKAVDVLRTKYGLTLDEARAKVRIDGKTDVARCLEHVIINALAGIAQAEVVGSVVGNQHPAGVN